MATYFVDDGGDNTDGSTWAKAYTSIQACDTARALASGDIIYIGADSNCTDAGAALSITGPTAGLPTVIISSTVGAGTTVSYSVGTGNQILATGGAFDITFNGAFAMYGIKTKAGRHIIWQADDDEANACYNCSFFLGSGGQINVATQGSGQFWQNCTIDCTADSGNQSAILISVVQHGVTEFNGLTLANVTLRTGSVFGGSGISGTIICNNGDFTGLTNGTLCELISAAAGQRYILNNCKTAATWGPFTGTAVSNFSADYLVTNTGPADAPTYLAHQNKYGRILSSDTVSRTGGATVEGDACTWWVSTVAVCSEACPYRSPYIYGTVSSTGAKTFTVHITNDTGDFDDSQVWLEVEYLKDADEAQWFIASDQRTNVTTTAAAQADDTTSTWAGGAAGFDTFMQTLDVAATIGETGQFRARVCVGVASIATTRDFYVDPAVTVS